MKKVLVVFGTRPEAIKMAPVIWALRARNCFDVRVCVTGQHREMLDQVLGLFGIVPDDDLKLMQPGQGLADITRGVLEGVGHLLRSWKPDRVLVHGDTTTTFSASLACFYEKIPVGHVEAGLRTGDIYSPWPEEMNRRLTSAIATLHFAPTVGAMRNLQREGVTVKTIHVTGNTVVDALLGAVSRIRTDEAIQTAMRARFSYLRDESKLILVTGHRRENFGQGFENLCEALRVISERSDVQIVYPVHLNPKVQEPVRRLLGNCPRIHLIAPEDYIPFVYLMGRSHLIVTDSGGIQEEAPSLWKPVLVTRATTERPEAVESGAAMLVGTDSDRIASAVRQLLEVPERHARMASAGNPFGDGNAAERIAEILCDE